MVVSYLSLIGLALVAPRKAARRILAPTPTNLDGLTLAIAASCVYLVGLSLIEQALGRTIVDVINALLDQLSAQMQAEVAAGRQEIAPELPRLAAIPPLWERALIDIAMNIALVSLGGGLIWFFGAQAGGTGAIAEIRAVLGVWLLAVHAPIALIGYALIFTASLERVPNILMMTIAALVYALFILAAFIAEAHRFRSTFLTFIALIFGVFALYILLGALIAPLLS